MLHTLGKFKVNTPAAQPAGGFLGFDRFQMQTLIHKSQHSMRQLTPGLATVLDRVRDLRGSNISWTCNTHLVDLLVPGDRRAAGISPVLSAPLAFFKIERGMFVPKVLVQTSEEGIDSTLELLRKHRACRSIGVEFLYLKHAHLSADYLYSRQFKQAFYGAFFCETASNEMIYCPTLRAMGRRSWDARAMEDRMSPVVA